MGLIVLETIAKSKEIGKIELEIPQNIQQGNHKALLFMEEEISEERDDFYKFFGDLNTQEKKEILHFIEFLYQKRIENTPTLPDLQSELLSRKKEALEEMERGELLDAKDVFTDIEATLVK
ncbi:MAG TPA: hypothetical protein PLG41_11160 [Leptospiraceae bacterium]|nr:hypothetical protein [Leptospiraceae bacterium]